MAPATVVGQGSSKLGHFCQHRPKQHNWTNLRPVSNWGNTGAPKKLHSLLINRAQVWVVGGRCVWFRDNWLLWCVCRQGLVKSRKLSLCVFPAAWRNVVDFELFPPSLNWTDWKHVSTMKYNYRNHFWEKSIWHVEFLAAAPPCPTCALTRLFGELSCCSSSYFFAFP